ncbi:hypothetical protein WDZ16_16145 [Pseudokineococcus marinus]|uniref:Uncharacterized protein n=1 Tax=Pseudokineococcus marinus TaxID=351215 RepID=A0A849BLA4_9ACTN|nr:hypothetical protein [Pseudokineococcus marinus]NNH22103.1 hypothetical protein [Pseudokineococcus marinus]
MNDDRLTVLRQVRPEPSLDVVWTADEQRSVLARILADRRTGEQQAAVPRRTKRAAVAGVAALALMAAPGLAVAIDDGIKERAFVDAYGYWAETLGGPVDPAAATRVVTAPGPYDGTFSVLASTSSEGMTCVATVFETASSATADLPDDFNDGGSFCHEAPSTRPFGLDTIMYGDTAVVWWAHAGDAVTGELVDTDGAVYPVVLAEGYLFGWYPSPSREPDDRPTLVGYAADGSEVGRFLM